MVVAFCLVATNPVLTVGLSNHPSKAKESTSDVGAHTQRNLPPSL